MKTDLRIALVGNPNTGKSTLFNVLTGLNQKIGNFPGVTVDKKLGYFTLADGRSVELIDLPGTYSLYPKSLDEAIVFAVLADQDHELNPDLLIVVLDASNLKRNLLLYTQVADLKIPVIVALNMIDLARKQEVEINLSVLSQKLGVPVIPIAARRSEGIGQLTDQISFAGKMAIQPDNISVEDLAPAMIAGIRKETGISNAYLALHIAHQHKTLPFISAAQGLRIQALEKEHRFHSQHSQAAETIARYTWINQVMAGAVHINPRGNGAAMSSRMDKILTHKIFGFIIFLAILTFMFQSVFTWSAYPMALIADGFVWIQHQLQTYLPPGQLTSLLLNGVVAGLSGVVVFIPQIAILFAFISVLEDTGYMTRVTFMLDKIMRKVGLNGKSVMPLIGSFACAVPSIMSTRNIENWKDRMITIMVTPLITCSARLPVYTLLISMVIPDKNIWWVFNLQGLALTAMYLLSLVSALVAGWVFRFILRAREKGYFIMELPVYRMPRWKNVLLTMYDRSKAFVFQAGKIIIAVSIVLWVLASYGPAADFERMNAAEKLENSYAGVFGHAIEPVIRPLGFDWKIGIALITSFAAREAFVGTMATIYSANGADKIESVQEKMSSARNHLTGKPVFTFAVSMSLMIFYAFAMQCVSTLAVTWRETRHWRWPLVQFTYMTALAYVASLITFYCLK